ncbi:M14 metallopeptidase family protein [Rheinheimera sp.]|uniref:M14 metallopeptidase family protein n=1 Tax=Rheinheimera sp. TaxID=1869214 RepID=UPI002FDD4DC5
MKNFTLLAALTLTGCIAAGGLAAQQQSDAQVPAPAKILGFAPGQWHARHDQIERYFRELATSQPERALLQEIGRTHEQRPLLQLVVSSKANMAKLDDIRRQHLAVAKGEQQADAQLPLVIWLGYSIHGNEPSGANAAMQLAHYLLSSDTAEVNQWLEQAIILIQPSLNPDGHDRFANWANMHQGLNPVADPQHREHVEPWPNGRPNHYWFDLNRDWLPLQHPESRARIAQFHHWLPQVLGDFHEMGTNSSYFFQPGIPSRNNPATPDENYKLTALLAQYHAKAFDDKGKLYYTEESFDDFYIGKGSTYPDVHGSIGILFEQASSRGHLQDSINGPLSFATTIENQLLTSLSTLRGAVAHKAELQQWQRKFFRDSQSLAADDAVQGYLLTESADQSRLQDLLQLLAQHQIKAYALTENVSQGEQQFPAGQSYFVPLKQSQYRLLKAAFSTETNFRDNTFYDVSAWTLPYAYNITFASSRKVPAALSKTPWQPAAAVAAPVTAGAYAYAIRWQDQRAPVLVQQLLAKGLQLRAASKAFSAETAEGVQQFAAGTVLVPAGLQQGDWFSVLQQAQQQHGLSLAAISSGLTPMGQDLGSNQMVQLKLPQVLVMAGPGVNSSEAGELWFNLERLAGVSPSLVEPARLGQIDLSRYSHILLPDGKYQSWKESDIAKLESWVKAGGVLWAQKSALEFVAKQGWIASAVANKEELKQLVKLDELRYNDKEKLAGQQRIAGAIFQLELDLSHPLSFGLPRAELPVFKNDLMLLKTANKDFVTVGTYRSGKQLAGFVAPELAGQISESPALLAQTMGKGRVIVMVDNPVFRGYFTGSSRILVNALYFAKAFDSASGDDEGAAE